MGSRAVSGDRRVLPVGMRILLGVGFGLALAATALVVFADDVKLLRLAAVLALWVALIAAFAIARSRRDTRAAERRQEEVRLAYEIELHREIAARAEYEARLGRQLEAAQTDQLQALRGEIDRLASAMSRLLDGDVLIERVTLSAESTRVRALGDAGATGAGRLATGGVAVLQATDRDMAAPDDTPSPDDAIVDGLSDQEVDDEAAAEVVADVDWSAEDEPDMDVVPEPPTHQPEPVNQPKPAAIVPQSPETLDGQEVSQEPTAYVQHDDDHPTLPLPAVQRSDAPATGWTWSHRASSPSPATAPPRVPVSSGSVAVATPAMLTAGADPAAELPESVEIPEPEDMPVELPEPADGSFASAEQAVEDLEDEDTDDHAVAIGDLLAAYGLDGGSRRRRRRD